MIEPQNKWGKFIHTFQNMSGEYSSDKQPQIYLALAGPSGIRAGWGIEINERFEVKRPLPSAEPPLGGQAATLQPYV